MLRRTVWSDDDQRQTGRSTRLARAALVAAIEGDATTLAVFVVASTYALLATLVRRVLAEAERGGVVLTRVKEWELVTSGKGQIKFIVAYSPDEMRRVCIGYGDVAVFVDHECQEGIIRQLVGVS